MSLGAKLVLESHRHLKWRAFDLIELVLMILCGILLFSFSATVVFDIVTRTIGHPWLWLQEVTQTLFIYAIFIGAAVATRRNDHLVLTAVTDALHGTPRILAEVMIRLVVISVSICLVYFGYINFLRGFDSFRMPSMTPIASLYGVIPISGFFIGLFSIEQLVNGLVNGFDHPQEVVDLESTAEIDTLAHSNKILT